MLILYIDLNLYTNLYVVFILYTDFHFV